MHNGVNHNTMIKEATKFLAEARDLEESVEDEGVFQYGRLPIPMMVIRNMVPKVSGQVTSVYSNWHWKEGEKRKALHFECATGNDKHVQALVDMAKPWDLVSTF